MNSLKILEEFGTISLKNKKIQNYIEKQAPFQYEEEYGVDFVHYSDENLMDIFIRKFHYYKPSVMSVVFGKYRQFYEYCVEKKYISWNPFRNSKFLSYEYLVRMAVKNGNVPYYSRRYVIEQCEHIPYCSAYYKSIALSVFEGIKSYAELAQLKWKDLDREQKIIQIGCEKISISEELFIAYETMREYTCFKNGETTLQFDKNSEALIRPLIRHGQIGKPSNHNLKYLSNSISKKMTAIGLSASGLYESGVMYKLVEAFGKEEIINYLLPECWEKETIVRKNKKFENFFLQNRIKMSGKDFGFDFKGYGLILKYGEIL